MKVSIITCTSNSASTLAWALKSIAVQTYQNIEHIIIDNNSSDKTIEIALQYPHITSVISAPDNGIYFGMNKGLQLVTGDIIGFLNSDDYLAAPDIIEKIVNKFKNSNSEAVYGNLIFVKKESPTIMYRLWKSKKYKHTLPLYGWTLPHPTFYVRKQVYEKYGLFNTDFKYAADYEIIIRFLFKKKIVVTHINEVFVYMRSGGVTNGNLSSRYKVHLEDRKVWESLGLSPRWYTLFLKPTRKIFQFIIPVISIKRKFNSLPEYQKDNMNKHII